MLTKYNPTLGDMLQGRGDIIATDPNSGAELSKSQGQYILSISEELLGR